jgi:hypothetical protein
MKIVFVFGFLFLISCHNSIIDPPDGNIPYGKWGFIESDSTLDIYEKVEEFDQAQGGFTFAQNGVFYLRSFGFCGTPPVAYYDVEGEWELIDDSLFRITYSEDWFETNSNNTIEIVSFSEDELHIIWDHL